MVDRRRRRGREGKRGSKSKSVVGERWDGEKGRDRDRKMEGHGERSILISLIESPFYLYMAVVNFI